MKRKFGFLSVILSLLLVLTASYASVFADNSEEYYLGGMAAGFSLKMRGVQVVGLCDVVTPIGSVSPSKDAGIKVGDVILRINDCEINDVSDIEKNTADNKSVTLQILSEGNLIDKTLLPAKDMSGNYKIGVFVRDSVSGIGTVTYIKDGYFASLGHPILDDDGKALEITGGSLFSCNVTGCIKGERGKAGELRGVFLRTNPIAAIEKNTTCGVFGKLNENFDCGKLNKITIGEAVPGNAQIMSVVDGVNVCKYDISIIKTDNYSENKNFVIKVTDKNLLDVTGGIVQGMSGSPIIQNGKLVGAVTHVFINDPTRGFGINISNMINN